MKLRPNRLAGRARGLLFAALAALGTGCGETRYPMDTFSPKSDLAERIQSLYIQVTLWDLLVFIIVVGIFAAALGWFSTRVGEPGEASDVESDLRLEIAWTVIPALILLAITVPTVRTVLSTQPSTWSKDALTVEVIGHQWWWEFRYPSEGLTTADEAHLPQNRLIHFQLISADVIHSFWVPALGGKRDVVPGQTNQITLVPKVPGMYYGQCAEYCGDSHANMRFRVFVDTPEGFKRWIAHEKQGPATPKGGPAAEGAAIWANAPCAICHTIRGISGFSPQYQGSFRGPDLTHFGSRTTLAGSILDNTPEHVAAWIENPDRLKPGVYMPNLGVKPEEASKLAAYLESLK